MRIALWLHLLATVVWVGGMFFAHVALRPAAAALAPPVRLPLISAALAIFLMWAGAAVVTILATGFMMIFARGGFTSVGGSVHVMAVLGLVMASIYGFIMAVPFPRVRSGVAAENWQAAGAALAQVRRLVGVNLILGLVTITVAVLGHNVIG